MKRTTQTIGSFGKFMDFLCLAIVDLLGPKRNFRIPVSTLIALVFSSLTVAYSEAQSGRLWIAGGYTFSDELGGFRILEVRGAGTRSDPIHIKQEMYSAYDATLTIRPLPQSNRNKTQQPSRFQGTIHLHIETVNQTNLTWVGFGFELQEELDVASDYLDGLSFDQISRQRDDIYSNRFLRFEDQFEPGDRLVYTEGHVNNRTSVATGFVITDFTPVPVFYLLQDPMIPFS